MVLFKERKELEEQYKQWLEENPEVKDCPFNVITFLQIIGRLKDNREMIPNKLMRIADEYGYEAQSRQLIEEMGELTVALNKEWRTQKNYMPSDEEKLQEARERVIEEIADVEVVLTQIKYLMQCEVEVMQVKKQKIDRQLLRIEANKG